MGTAFMKSLLCLLGDLERHISVDSSDTVSLERTVGIKNFVPSGKVLKMAE
jgi:hypothetical protein